MSESNLNQIALKKAMALCANREICPADIKQKLLIWGVDNKEIQKIINHLINEKFIDEKRYALAFVTDKFRYNRWGKIKIASALRMKNIAESTINEALNSIDNDIYSGELSNIIATHRKVIKAKNKYDLKGKLLRYGLSKGFESHLLYDLLNEDE
jgi:regulatory protein